MIDFPASPTDGQIFSATNGVVYKYSATYHSWLAQNPAPPLGGTGDFCALQFATGSITTTATTLTPPVLTGNSGLWYAAGTGRYTPPAGRYAITATLSALCPTLGSILTLFLRKNGTTVSQSNVSFAAASTYIEAAVSLNLDANGSDYFDIQALSSTATATVVSLVFQASPLTGMQGPTGGAPGPVVGDFYATVSATYTPTTTAAAIPFNTVKTGNSGGYLNVANGRFTPPAGRYYIFASATFIAQSATVSTGALDIRKNGISGGAYGSTTVNGNQFSGEVKVDGTFDANGSDYFEIYGAQSVVAMNCSPSQIWFGAYPTQGMVGPPGPPGPAGNATAGDFFATSTAAIPAATQTILFPTVVTGNTGSYYNPANGQYKPPAGRYRIQACLAGSPTAAAATQVCTLRKNGAALIAGTGSAAAAFMWAEAFVDIIVDANGSDVFDVQNGGTLWDRAGATSWFSATPTTGLVGPPGPTGPIGQTQTVFFETGAMATGTTVIPCDDTIPQQTEGDQYMSLSITPQSATSKLIIEVKAVLSSAPAGANNVIAALFQDSTANALAASAMSINANSQVAIINFTHVMTSGTTSATTFKVRGGTSISATTTFNGQLGGRIFGGVMASSIVIREVP